MAGLDQPVSAGELIEALRELSALVRAEGLRATVRLVGGTAIIYRGLTDRAITRDVDTAQILPPEVAERMRELIGQVAAHRGWHTTWMNLEVRGVPLPDYTSAPVWEQIDDLSDTDGLIVELARPGALLALKLNASRPGRDDSDIRGLMEHLGLGTTAEADALFETYFPGEALPDKAVRLLRTLDYPEA